MNAEDRKQDRLTLEVLSAIDSGPGISQRRLASQMGIALGLTNSYIKRCVRKGFIKINEAPANRYLYYLTPKGFREKTRLTARFLSNSLDFYRAAADSCDEVYARCVDDGVAEVLLCGDSDLAEIALLKSLDGPVQVVGLYDPGSPRARFYSRPVWQELAQAPRVARVVTALVDAEATWNELSAEGAALPVFVPAVLGLRQGSNEP